MAARDTVRILTLLLAAGLLRVSALSAQNGDATISTNEVQQSDEAVGTDATDALADESDAMTNSVAETNTPATPGPDGRTRRLRRQRRPRSNDTSNGSQNSSLTGTNGAPRSLDYSAFRLVAERNIFDPNRSPRSSRAPTQAKTVDSFSLVGTMSYEKGDFAFFDGSSSDYKKVLKTNDMIASYKVVAISPELVKIVSGTNLLDLKVGTQMRRRENGTWEREASPAAYTASTSSATPSEAAAPSGAESDVLKKMMQRREKE
jgi:hypothetical protein